VKTFYVDNRPEKPVQEITRGEWERWGSRV